MTEHRPSPFTSRYRIVVKANDASRRRGFFSEIVSDETESKRPANPSKHCSGLTIAAVRPLLSSAGTNGGEADVFGEQRTINVRREVCDWLMAGDASPFVETMIGGIGRSGARTATANAETHRVGTGEPIGNTP